MEEISRSSTKGLQRPGAGANTRSCPKSLREWLDRIEKAGELHRVAAPVALKEELSAITYLAARDEKAPALLFDKFGDYRGDARVLTNMLGSSVRRYAIALGLDAEAHLLDLIQETRNIMTARIPPVLIDPKDAPVNEIVRTGDDVDLTMLPVPQFWPGDGGPYIGTADISLTRHPETSRINVGVYRQMLHGPRRVGMYCSPGKHGKIDREAWWAQGKPCEVVVAYGIDPILFMVGAQSFSIDESELDVAGGMMGVPVEVTSGVATSLPIPAHAEIVIEGLLHPGDTEMEGPLGEFTGYYGGVRSAQPVIEVKALHMRRAPILTAALMANYPSCEIGAYYAIMRSARVWDDLQKLGVPGIRGVYAHPAAASGWGMLVVSVAQQYAGHVAQVLSLAGQCPAAAYYTKWIIAVDEDVDPTDLNQVLWALSTRCSPVDDIDIQRNTWSTGLDPSRVEPELRPYGSKAYINACKPHRHLKSFPKRTLIRRSVYENIAKHWSGLGFSGTAPRLPAFHDEN